jgi:hypothetical protein
MQVNAVLLLVGAGRGRFRVFSLRTGRRKKGKKLPNVTLNIGREEVEGGGLWKSFLLEL